MKPHKTIPSFGEAEVGRILQYGKTQVVYSSDICLNIRRKALHSLTIREFWGLGVRTPYSKRYLLLRKLPVDSRVPYEPKDKAHAPEHGFSLPVGVYTSIIAKVQSLFTKTVWSSITIHLAHVVALISAVYLLISQLLKKNWGDAGAAAVIVVTNLYALCTELGINPLKDIKEVINDLQTAVSSTYTPDSSHALSGNGHPSPSMTITIMKAVSFIGAMITTVCGLDVTRCVGQINGLQTLSSSLSDTIAGVLLDCFGVDITGLGALQEAATKLEQTGNKFLNAPVADFKGQVLQEAIEWKKNTEEFVRLVKNNTINTSTLQALLSRMSTRISETLQALRAKRTRPCPVAIAFYGDKGVGKTDFVNCWLIPQLNSAFGLPDNNIYSMNTGKYFLTYHGEKWAVYDELGAQKEDKQGENTGIFLNNIISGAPSVMPSAGVAGKEQAAGFAGVFTMSNLPLDKINIGLTAEAKSALKDRFIEFEVVDPGRTGSRFAYQAHRSLSFTHLTFKMHCAPDPELTRLYGPQNNGCYELKAQDVYDLVIKEIKQHQDRFKNYNAASHQAAPAGFELWDQAHISTHTPVIWIAGKPGVGKTERFKPLLLETLKDLGVPVFESFTESSLPGAAWILDDAFNPSVRDEQEFFNAFYNRRSRDQAIFVITNYGRMNNVAFGLPIPLGPNTGIQELKELVPGFMRRSQVDTPNHFLIHDTGARNYAGDRLRTDQLVHEVLKRWSSSRMPEFKKSQAPLGVKWDVDVFLPANCGVKEILNALSQARPHYVIHFSALARLIHSTEGAPVVERIGTCFDYVARNCPDLSVRAFVGNRVLAYYKGVIYSELVETLTIKYEATYFTLASDSLPEQKIEVTELHEYLTGELKSPSAGMVAFMQYSRMNHPRTKEVVDHYPLSWKQSFLKAKAVVARHGAWLFKFIWRNWKAAIFFAVLAVVLWYLLSKQKEHKCSCKGTPYEDIEDCPFDEAHRGGKGKNKGRRTGKFFHAKAMKIGNNVIYSDDIEDNDHHERIWHQIQYLSRESGKEFSFNIGNMKYNVAYNDSDMRWDVAMEDSAHSSVFNTRLRKLLKNQMRKILVGSNTAWGLMITGTTMLVPHHYVHAGEMRDSESGEKLNPAWKDPARELCYLRYKRPLPGIKDISGYLLGLDEIRTVSRATVYVPTKETEILFTNDYNLWEAMKGTFNCSELVNWGANVGTIAYGNFEEQSLEPGDCGSPIIAIHNGACKLLGIHCGQRVAQQKFCSNVLSVEAWNEYLTGMKDTSHCRQTYVSVTETHPHKEEGVVTSTIYMPREVTKKIVEKAPGPSYHPTGAVTLMGHVRNKKPMDAKGDKREYGEMETFTNTLEPKKKIALSESAIFCYHGDKIPEDKKGLKWPHAIRSKRLEINYPLYDKETVLIQLGRILGARAVTLAGAVHPLGVEDAIRGNYQVQSIDLSTSAGVMVSLATGKRMKSDCFRIRGDEVIFLEPLIKQWTEDQYRLAKQGIRLSIPADANLKSEPLREGKEWKKRVFYNVPLPTVINLKRILGPIQHALTNIRARSPYQFSLWPLRDWNDLAIELLRVGNHIISLDASSYDHSVSGSVLRGVAAFTCEMHRDRNHEQHGLDNRIITLFEEVINMPTLFQTTLVSKQGGVPSGVWGTSLIDAVAWDIMLLYCWKKITGQSSYDYFTKVVAKFMGDDAIISVEAPLNEEFNAFTIRDCMEEEFNIIITPPSKAGELKKETKLDEAQFCSRSFIRFPEKDHIWIPKLKIESIHSTLTFSAERDPVARYEQYRAVGFEVMAWGKEKWDLYQQALSAYAEKHKIFHSYMCIEDMYHLAWQELISPCPIVNTEPTPEIFRPAILKDITPGMSTKRLRTLHREVLFRLRISGSWTEFIERKVDDTYPRPIKELLEENMKVPPRVETLPQWKVRGKLRRYIPEDSPKFSAVMLLDEWLPLLRRIADEWEDVDDGADTTPGERYATGIASLLEARTVGHKDPDQINEIKRMLRTAPHKFAEDDVTKKAMGFYSVEGITQESAISDQSHMPITVSRPLAKLDLRHHVKCPGCTGSGRIVQGYAHHPFKTIDQRIATPVIATCACMETMTPGQVKNKNSNLNPFTNIGNALEWGDWDLIQLFLRTEIAFMGLSMYNSNIHVLEPFASPLGVLLQSAYDTGDVPSNRIKLYSDVPFTDNTHHPLTALMEPWRTKNNVGVVFFYPHVGVDISTFFLYPKSWKAIFIMAVGWDDVTIIDDLMINRNWNIITRINANGWPCVLYLREDTDEDEDASEVQRTVRFNRQERRKYLRPPQAAPLLRFYEAEDPQKEPEEDVIDITSLFPPKDAAHMDSKTGASVSATAVGAPPSVDAPAMVEVPTAARGTSEVMSTSSTLPGPVLKTVGGLGPEGVIPLNDAQNLLSSATKATFIRDINVSVDTVAGYTLLDVPFNPWDEAILNPAHYRWAKEHEVFSGSMSFAISVRAGSTINGSIILAYVPPMLQKSFVPTRTNLTALYHVELSLQEAGTQTLTMTGAHYRDVQVLRKGIEAGECYGRIIIATMTNITNSYGAALQIPVTLHTWMESDAQYTCLSYLTGRSPDTTIHAGPKPGAKMFVMDSNSYWEFNDPEPIKTKGIYLEDEPYVAKTYLQQEIRETTTKKMKFTWGWNETESSAASITWRRWPGEGAQFYTPFHPDSKLPFLWKSDDPVWRMTYTGAYQVNQQFHEKEDSAQFRVHSTSGTSFGYLHCKDPPAYPFSLVHYNIFKEIDTKDRQLFIAYTEDLDDAITGWPDWGIAHAEMRATQKLSIVGAPTCILGADTEKAPTGFAVVYFGTWEFVPAVETTISSASTVLPPREWVRFMREVRRWLKENPRYQSYSYSMQTTTGDDMGTLLFNHRGCFIRVKNSIYSYYVFTSGEWVTMSNFQAYTSQFPQIRPFDTTLLINRRSGGGRGYGYKTHTSDVLQFEGVPQTKSEEFLHVSTMYEELKNRVAELEVTTQDASHAAAAGALIGGGLLQGIGQGLGAFGSYVQFKEGLKANQKLVEAQIAGSRTQNLDTLRAQYLMGKEQQATARALAALRMGHNAKAYAPQVDSKFDLPNKDSTTQSSKPKAASTTPSTTASTSNAVLDRQLNPTQETPDTLSWAQEHEVALEDTADVSHA